MSSPVAPSAFKTSNVTFSTVKMLESGGKQAYLNYNGGPLLMQVGSLESPFGMSVYDKVQPPKYSVELNLRGYDDPGNSPNVVAIFDSLMRLDEFMIDQGVKNCKSWFKKESVSKELITELYTPSVRFAKDSTGARKPYPPTMKIQLRKRDGRFDVDIYDASLNSMKGTPIEDILVKRAQLTVLMKCTGVWFAGGKFGLSWKAEQIRADKIPATIRGPAFLPDESGGCASHPSQQKDQFAALSDDEDDVVNDEEALAPPTHVKAAPPPAEDDEEEDAPEVISPAAVPKKTVLKKLVKKVAGK
jgi:hypothetical protein